MKGKSQKAKIKNIKWPEIILGLMVIFYIVFFSVITIQRHRSLNSGYYDLAIMDQTVYNSSKGRMLEVTNPEGTENFKRMAIHNDIILAILTPFYFLYSGPETLLVIQTIILALGAIPLYLLAVNVLRSRLFGLVFSFVYLIYPGLQNANLFDFHAVTLATSLLLFMVYFIYIKRYLVSLIFLVLAILTKEQVALTTAMYGVYLLLKNQAFKKNDKHRNFYLTMIIISIFWFVLSIWVIIPYFRQGQHFALYRYKELGTTPKEVISGILFKPQILIKQLINADNLKYLFQLVAPLAFLPLFAPAYFFILIPELAINILSSHWQMRTIDLHYQAVIIPFMMVGSVFASNYILSKFKIMTRLRLAALLLFVCMIMGIFQGTRLFSKDGKITQYFKIRSEIEAVNFWKKILKNEDIILSVSENLGPHFSQRKVFYRFSKSYKRTDYVLILIDNIYNDWLDPEDSTKNYQFLTRDPNFKLIYKKDAFEVYEKVKSL